MRVVNVGNNKIELLFNSDIILFSYQTPVALLNLRTPVTLYRTQLKHSRTTQRHITEWLRSYPLPSTLPIKEKPQHWFDDIVDSIHIPKHQESHLSTSLVDKQEARS